MTQRKDVFTAQRDGNVYRWFRYRWPVGVLSSTEGFTTLAAAEEAGRTVAQCYNGLYASAYTGDPAVATWAAEGAPSCGADWSGNYDVDSAENREDHIGI